MASVELKRVARESEAAISGLQSALDRASRAVPYYNVQSLSDELTALSADQIVDGNIDKDRVIDLLTLSANLLYYLRGMEGSSNNTILETAPLNAANLKAYTDKLGI